jgi:hypothetical protein
MECEKCHRERERGRTYQFYYGTKGRPEKSIERGMRVTRTPFRVAGRESVWLCQRCVLLPFDLGFGLSAGLLGVFAGLMVLVGLAQSLLEPSSRFGMGGECLAGVALPLLLLSLGTGVWYARWGRRRTKLGERLAIRLRKPTLRRQGHDAFLTTEQYERMEKS